MPKKSNKSWDNRGGRAAASIDNKRYDKHYFAHDDRVPRSGMGSYLGGSRPRVSFKTQRSNKEMKLDMCLAQLDEDVTMKTSSNNNTRSIIFRDRGRGGRSRGRNSPLPSRNFQAGQSSGQRVRTNQLSKYDWYKITIPYGHKYEKNDILRNLLKYMAPEIFIPINYRVIENNAVFYVDDYKAANALKNCDRKLTMTDGFKLQVRVKEGYTVPPYEINDKLKERLKQAMQKRYIAETNALNLSKFHQDADLADYFCALFRPAMLKTVLEIVAEHIPTLEALNLEGNKIQTIQGLSALSKMFPNLKILYIGDNKIREMNDLDALQDLKLEELRLQGNPVCKKYKSSRQIDYISDVRKRFTKLMRLDGTELPRPISFDMVDETAKLPSLQRIFASNAKAHEIASRFLQQYLMIFDSDNRQPLLNAYTEHACFSSTITYTHSKLNDYLDDNRNLFRVNDSSKRIKLLKNGKLPVVSYLSGLPQTKHLLDTFTMDITLPTPTMMFVTLTGYFQEVNNKEEPIRYFNRTFIIIPEGAGYCICNEQIHISQPTDAHLKQLKSQLSQSGQPTPLLLQGSAEQSAPIVPQTSVEQPATLTSHMPIVVETVKSMGMTELSEEIKQHMVFTLSQETEMNLQWSLKCLHEVQWNYNNALTAFQTFHKLGRIPPEAFAK